MARPKKPDHERRTQSMSVALTDAEKAQLEQAARTYGLGLSEFIRRRILGVRLPAAIGDQQQAAEATAALLRLGVNLNQIARHTNAGRALPAGALSTLIERVNSAMDQLDESNRNRAG